MSEEDGPPPRFAGRTYSRTRKSAAGRALDESGDSKTVPVKAAMSISKWGKANYVPVRESSEGASEPKKQKLESKGEDPFSFETEDKRKLIPGKKQDATAPEPEVHQPTKLPASRIVIKGRGYEEYLKAEKEKAAKSPAFRTYSRTSPRKPIIMNQFVEVGKTTATGQTVFFSEAGLAEQNAKNDLKKETDEDDDIFPVQFKRDPLKTYSGEVVTPVDKPDSPPPKKSGYKKKGGPRGRKPLTVSDPDLIEEYRRNYAAQLLKGKPDTAVGGLSNSMVVSKQELANEAQGTTLVVVCKPKAQIEKGEVQTKYFAKNSKPKGTLVPVTPDTPAFQDSHGENKNTDCAAPTQSSTEATPTRTSARLRNISPVAANSEGASPVDRSASNVQSESQVGAKRASRNKNSDVSHESPSTSSPSVSTTPSSESNSQGDMLSARGGKRYRIFKSRAPQVEEELKSAVSKEGEEDGEGPLSSSETDTCPGNDTQPSSNVNDDNATVEQTEEKAKENSQLQSDIVEILKADSVVAGDVVEDCEDVSNSKQTDPSVARELLAARLRNIEKTNDSDSVGEPDNASECSENLTSQESPSNSQNVSEESSQKEGSAGAPRKFFKSKKSLSGSSDLQRKIFGNSPQKVGLQNCTLWLTSLLIYVLYHCVKLIFIYIYI